MHYLLDLCANKSVTLAIEKKIRRIKMLKHNNVFIIDIQDQGIETKDKDVLLEVFEGLMCNTSSLVKKPSLILMSLLGQENIPKDTALLWSVYLKKKN